MIDDEDPGATPVPSPPESLASPELSALVELVEGALALAEPPPKRYKRASWELVQHARDVRRAEKAEARVLRLEDKSKDEV